MNSSTELSRGLVRWTRLPSPTGLKDLLYPSRALKVVHRVLTAAKSPGLPCCFRMAAVPSPAEEWVHVTHEIDVGTLEVKKELSFEGAASRVGGWTLLENYQGVSDGVPKNPEERHLPTAPGSSSRYILFDIFTGVCVVSIILVENV